MENQSQKRAWWVFAQVFLLTWSFLPLAKLAGVAGWGHGARYLLPNAVGALFTKAGLIFVGSYFFLVFPTAYLIYGEATEKLRGLGRVMLVTGLLCLPIFSYAYNLGHFREPLDYSETAVSLGVGVFTQVLIFEWSGSVLILALGTTLTLFVPLFLVNELLGPYFVYANYAPYNMAIYWMHRLTALVAVGFCLWQTRRAWTRSLVSHARHADGNPA